MLPNTSFILQLYFAVSTLDIIKYEGCNISIKCLSYSKDCSLILDSDNATTIERSSTFHKYLSMAHERNYSIEFVAFNDSVMINYTYNYIRGKL